MINYAELSTTFRQMLVEFGSELTVRGKPMPADPVTGMGGGQGITRPLVGALTDIDYSVFPETRVRSGDQQIVFSDEVQVGELWVRSVGDEPTIAEVEVVKPGDTALVYIALVRS